MDEKMGLSHQIMLYNREKGNLTGILDVISFDENTIVLDTDMGLLTIKGKDLHVSRLTLEKGGDRHRGTGRQSCIFLQRKLQKDRPVASFQTV